MWIMILAAPIFIGFFLILSHKFAEEDAKEDAAVFQEPIDDWKV